MTRGPASAITACRAMVLCGAFCILVVAAAATAEEPRPSPAWRKRWVFVPSNLYVRDNVEKLRTLLTRARDAGYTGVYFTDFKTTLWWNLDEPRRWSANAGELRRMTRELGLELVCGIFPFGRSEAILTHDPNLAAGMPVRDVVLIARGDRLVPEQSAEIRNGSFEEFDGDNVRHFGLQDFPGQGSFIDREVVRHGQVSIRFEDIGRLSKHGNGRVSQTVRVKPWHQYRIRVWMKTEHLNAGEIKVFAMAGGRVLQWQHVMAHGPHGPVHVGGANDLTTDWIEQSVTFNSLHYTSVNIYAGIWQGRDGKIWWDDLRLDAVPTLNLLRRDSTPLSLIGEDGTAIAEGRDVARIEDPKLGRLQWAGTYDTRHEPPAVTLSPDSRITEGQRVLLSGYHASIVHGQEVNCSMADPAVFRICADEVRHAREALNPDGYFMQHDEIRCTGWEPLETARFKTSGELLAGNIAACFRIARKGGGGKPVYVWSDMFDPHHNARDNFYLVNNTLANSWEGLDTSVIVMKWHCSAPGLSFFAQRGHAQMIAAFYDHDVTRDHQQWTAAMQGLTNVIGVMYTTWRGDYSKLEEFARVWWDGATQPPGKAPLP